MPAFDSINANINTKLHESIEEIYDFCKKVNMIEFLTYSAFLSRIGFDIKEGYKYMSPLHFEYFMGIFLSIGFDNKKCGKGSIEENGKILNTFDLLLGSWKMSNSFRKIQGKSSIEEVDKGLFEASLISTGGTMRGYSWYSPMHNQYYELFKPFDEYLKEKIGFGIEDAFNYIHKINNFYNIAIENVRNEISKSGLVTNLCDSEEFGMELFCAMHSFEYTQYLFFDETDIQKIDESVNLNSLKSFLDFFSVNIAQDKNDNFRYFNDKNIFADHPIIKLNNKYFVINTNPIYWSIKDRLEQIIKQCKNEWQKYNKCKSDYLEDTTISLFKKALPVAKVYKSLYYYSTDGKRCELDGLVIYDNCILIIEAKSGIFSKSAQSGGVKRLKNVLYDNIEYAAYQAHRTKEYILSCKEPHFEDEHKKEVLRIKKNGFENIYLINVTMEYFSELSVNLKQLKKLGIMDIQDFPWSVSLSDLEVIIDLIQFPNQFLHYIYFREKFSNRVQIQNHFKHIYELDMFGFYLLEESDSLTKYFIEDINENTFAYNAYFEKQEDCSCHILDFSSIFNEYYNEKEKGILIEPPQKKYNSEFYLLVRQLEEYIYQGKGYTNFSINMLDLDNEKQEHIIAYIHKVIQMSKKDGKQHDISIPFMNGNFDDKATYGITIMSGYQVDRQEIFRTLQSLCITNRYKYKYTEWFGLCAFVDDTRHLVNNFFLVRDDIKCNPKMDALLKTIPFKKLKVGRNDPCPCGRGQKYKRCCGR